jgi:hypothetical protein
MTDATKQFQERIIEDYIRKELAAYGMVEFHRDGIIVYSGNDYDYLLEVKAHRISKTVRLAEG